MPHDQFGNALEVGDMVLVKCYVKAIHLTEDYCNVDLEVKERMPPAETITKLTLNSKQTVLDDNNARIRNSLPHCARHSVINRTCRDCHDAWTLEVQRANENPSRFTDPDYASR